jgi:hypothetical protein
MKRVLSLAAMVLGLIMFAPSQGRSQSPEDAGSYITKPMQVCGSIDEARQYIRLDQEIRNTGGERVMLGKSSCRFGQSKLNLLSNMTFLDDVPSHRGEGWYVLGTFYGDISHKDMTSQFWIPYHVPNGIVGVVFVPGDII